MVIRMPIFRVLDKILYPLKPLAVRIPWIALRILVIDAKGEQADAEEEAIEPALVVSNQCNVVNHSLYGFYFDITLIVNIGYGNLFDDDDDDDEDELTWPETGTSATSGRTRKRNKDSEDSDYEVPPSLREPKRRKRRHTAGSNMTTGMILSGGRVPANRRRRRRGSGPRTRGGRSGGAARGPGRPRKSQAAKRKKYVTHLGKHL